MFRKLLNSSKFFHVVMLIAFVVFAKYPPVSFYLSNASASHFGNQIVLIVFFVVMFGAALYSKLTFEMSIRRNLKAFEVILDHLKLEPKSNLEDDLYKTRKLFSDSILTEVWRKYEKTIRSIEAGSKAEGEVKFKYLASVESNYFFNEDIIYRNLKDYKFINYVPQMLTALGIFGTFLGLVIGLIGVDFNDVSNTTNSIKLLLNGVQISFRTSIFGIAFSLILTIQQKFLLEAQESKVGQISDEIDSIFPMNTQADGINQLYVELEKQTASLQKLGTEIAEAVSNKFDTSLQKTLGPTLENFAHTTEQLIEIVKTSNQATISSIVDNIGTIISSSTGKELERLQASIGTMTERNESLLSEFERTIQTLQSLVQSQQSVISETNQSADNAMQMKDNILKVTDELGKIISGLNNFAGVQQNSYDGYLELVNKVKETLTQQDQSLILFKETVEQSITSSQIQKYTSEKLALTIERLEEFNQDFREILTDMKNGISAFEDASDHISNTFNVTLTNLGNTHETISESLQGIASGLNETIKNLEIIVSEDLHVMREQYSAIIKNIAGFSEKSDILVHQLATFVDANQGAIQLWQSYKGSFEELNQEIKTGVMDYTLNVREGLQNLFEDYDEHISKVLGEFKSTIDNFQGSLDELTDILDQQNLKGIQQQSSKIIQEGNMVIKGFGDKMDELMEVYRQAVAARMTSK